MSRDIADNVDARALSAHSYMPTRIMRLEERIVLEATGVPDAGGGHHTGDAGHDNAGPAAQPNAGVTTTHSVGHADGHAHEQSAATRDAPHHALAVSSSVEQAGALVAARADDVSGIVFDGQHTTLEGLLQQIRNALHGPPAESIALATHGDAHGGLELTAGLVVNLESLQNPEMQAFWQGMAELVAPGGRIDLLACDVAAGAEGHALVAALEDLTGVDFAASTDQTGNAAQGADWVLETDHADIGAVYFNPTRVDGFTGVLASPNITDTDPGNTATGTLGAAVVDSGLTVTDGGNGNLLGAAVRIKTGFAVGQDQLDFDGTLAAGYGISGSYDAATGQLLLSGSATAAQYQEVLRTVTYENTSATPDQTPREIYFVVGVDHDSRKYCPETGHYYRINGPPPLTVGWAAANTGAGDTLDGMQGYLATITSAAENTAVSSLAPMLTEVWIGASDSAVEGQWEWAGGPEAGLQFWAGAAGGSAVNGMFNNWLAGQPDDAGSADCLTVDDVGQWRDANAGASHRFIIEYGGMSADVEGAATASVTMNVADPNDAPVLDNTGDMILTPIAEDNVTSAGDSVADIIASAGGDRITDADAGPLEGIALSAIDDAHGTWQYSLDGGTNWLDVGAVADNNALLLRDTDLLRFQPDSDYNGHLADGVTFRAWDQTSGVAGDYADASVNGGNSAFSTATESAALDITAVNDAPVLDNSGTMHLSNIDEDFLDNSGDSIADLIASAGGDHITDADAGAVEGIALVGLDGSHGTWQYSLDGGAHWLDVGAVSDANALLLQSTDLIRFQPEADWHGSLASALTFRAWDQTSGTAGGHADTTSPGGSSAFSVATEVAGLTVDPVNDAPLLANPLVDQHASEDGAFSYQFAGGSFSDVDIGDVLSYSATLADGSPLPDWLTFDPLTRLFSGTPSNGDVGSLDVRVTADDGHGGQVSDVFALTVENVNDAPTVATPLSDQSVEADSAVAYQFAADAFHDEDVGDTLSYTATLADGGALPAWLTFDGATRQFGGTPGSEDVGTLEVRVTASDGHGGEVADIFTITITAAAGGNGTPQVPSQPNLGVAPHLPSQPPSSGDRAADAGEPSVSTTTGGAVAGDGGLSTTPVLVEDGDTAQTSEVEVAGGAATSDVAVEGQAESAGNQGREHGGNGTAAIAIAGVVGPGQQGGGHDGQANHIRNSDEEELDLGVGELSAQISSAMFTGDLLADATQPSEFRDVWNTIIVAYSDSGEELTTYLQSAFRTVTESACINHAAQEAIDAVLAELAQTTDAAVHDRVDELLARVVAARRDVRMASSELEQAIHAADQAGREDSFDQVLEDVITAALERLMSANERLFVEARALAATTALVHSGRLAGSDPTEANALVVAAAHARRVAQAEFVEMRKSWDRVAQDVFAAFVTRLVTRHGGQLPQRFN